MLPCSSSLLGPSPFPQPPGGAGGGLEEVRVATLERVHSLELLVVLAVDHLPRLLSPPEGGRIAERLLEVRVAEVRDESLGGSPLLTLD